MSKNLTLDEILALPAVERLRVVEQIWDSIASEPESLPLTEAQQREIESRLEEFERNPSIAISWEVARARLRETH